uniref:Uncharacterized protein n=1 Tax=Nelumbo nucifera TaxID=4432 RepID=A0A822Y846_NELNU|nr:TPA_asm: hypothetical protein HUJ06_027226 [Nelumbo nucifera]
MVFETDIFCSRLGCYPDGRGCRNYNILQIGEAEMHEPTLNWSDGAETK